MIECSNCSRLFNAKAEGLNPQTRRLFHNCARCREAKLIESGSTDLAPVSFSIAQRQARLTLLEEMVKEWEICPNNGTYTKQITARLSAERYDLAKRLDKGG